MIRVLIIEDNAEIVANMTEYLGEEQYNLDCAYDGAMGLHLATTNTYDVILLDLNLPGIDGITLCRRLREDSRITTPIIMLTARHTVDEKVLGLQTGADDYLVKPFSLSELEARIIAIMRREKKYRSGDLLQVGNLTFDLQSLQVTRNGEVINLSAVPLKILEKLMRSYPNVVTKAELGYVVWGDNPPDSDSLRTHIHSLRSAIDKPFEKQLLVTIHGIGYRLVMPK